MVGHEADTVLRRLGFGDVSADADDLAVFVAQRPLRRRKPALPAVGALDAFHAGGRVPALDDLLLDVVEILGFVARMDIEIRKTEHVGSAGATTAGQFPSFGPRCARTIRLWFAPSHSGVYWVTSFLVRIWSCTCVPWAPSNAVSPQRNRPKDRSSGTPVVDRCC